MCVRPCLKGEPVDMWAYITHDPVFTQYGDVEYLVVGQWFKLNPGLHS